MIRSAVVLSLALALPAGAFDLDLPVDCNLGDDCYIQQYLDHDPGLGSRDFTCGPLAYDTHNGTDFALPTRKAMQDGVAVLAAASGRVARVRDGVKDFAPVVTGKECGNAIVIEHGSGWETQYCHLKLGSIRVKPGDVVRSGTPLGLVGQSGAADFPHLHLTVRQNGTEVDPFAPTSAACGTAQTDLWGEEVAVQPGGFLDIGITTIVPDFDAIKYGLTSADLPGSAPALVLWVYAFGLREGDQLTLTLTGPDGAVVAETLTVDRTQALAFRASGRKRTAEAWPAGPYEGTAVLTRNGTEIDRIDTRIVVGP